MEYQEKAYMFPHVKSSLSTGSATKMMVPALLPCICFAVYSFGIRVLLHLLICALAGVVSEFAFEAFLDLPLEADDFSSGVTGMLLALMLPVNAPLWAGAVGTVFAVIAVKMILGLRLKVRLNPALAGYVFLLLVFPGFMRDYSFGEYGSETLLADFLAGETVDPLPMLTGATNGEMGAVCAAAVLLGLIILLGLGVIKIRIPAFACASFALVLTLLYGNRFSPITLIIHACGGGFLFVICFMAADYASSPITKWGQIFYAVIIGAAAACLRYAGIEEAPVYAVLLANLLVPLLERFTVPRAFGTAGRLRSGH